MATADQIKNLVRAYTDRDDEKFKTVVLQIAAHEARIGHDNTARELKKTVDSLSANSGRILRIHSGNTMLQMSVPSVFMKDLIVSRDLEQRLQRVLCEYHNRRKLQSFGLTNRRKLLMEGAPGTGKTFTASIIASELGLPLYTVQMDKLVTKYMGETSAKLHQVFEYISSEEGVYFFDEFDAIGSDRNLDNEVGEMRRILNSFLQFIEMDDSESIIVAATNNQKLLDKALFRRFDDVLHYDLPLEDEVIRLFKYKLEAYDEEFVVSSDIVDCANGLSHAEIIRICDDAIKTSILYDKKISTSDLLRLIDERHMIYKEA
ncbi:MAG: ATP-binding protein [Lachnospiraceae bacterium]|nr:ATP-binding protein [Lachnospiraceae bacterium]